MENNVHRFLLRAHPTENHPKYYSWNIADICIFVCDSDKAAALKKALDKLDEEKWVIISEIHKSTLIEDQIKQAGGEVLDAYNLAKRGQVVLMVFTDNWIGFKNSPPVLVPRITEKFMDGVIQEAGGNRLEYDLIEGNKARNADYILGDYIFELKILEEERLFKESTRDKVADFFYDSSLHHIEISPKNLSQKELNYYLNLFRNPIQNAVKSASKQIKSTKDILKKDHLKGGLIFVNNGTTSITPEIFEESIIRSITNDTSQIDLYISICNWLTTDGFNSHYLYAINPKTKNETQKLIAEAFDHKMSIFMNEWGRGGFSQDIEMLEPLKNISFKKYGVVFTKYGTYED